MQYWLYVLPAPVTTPWCDWPMLQSSEQGVLPTTLGQLAAEKNSSRQLVILPVEWASWCRDETHRVQSRAAPSSRCYALAEHLPSDQGSQYLALAPLDKQGCASAWSLDRGRLRRFRQALQQVGVEVERMVIDVDLLPPDSSEALWLAGRWLVGGNQDVRLAVVESQRIACAAQLGPGLIWPPTELDPVVHDLRVLTVLVERAVHATDLLQEDSYAHRLHLPWYALATGALLLLLTPTGVDLYHARQLEQAAKQLDNTSVAAYAQRRADRASLAMLGARLKVTEVDNSAEQARIAEQFQQVRAAAIKDQQAHVLRMEYDQGKWQLEVQVKSFEDIGGLQDRWLALGFQGEVGSVHKNEQGLQIHISLKQVTRS
ncbi:hypothetical protein C4K35_4096 [Pseudomonas chlororaphis subsp. piscium]|uniref:type II secretion system protein GspL n=1 Tax=Pseudomonas chlororaphis TaxID=587753 RepID=UPI000F565F28|nr:type II secretion system protein GspL [Pseudomonas chlororaphis]AZC51675.1 hypothetical protein C4K35_4096 [Pseudomonas chlororaphis subsp. piscium]